MDQFNCNPTDFQSANQDPTSHLPENKPKTSNNPANSKNDSNPENNPNNRLPDDASVDPKVKGSIESKREPVTIQDENWYQANIDKKLKEFSNTRKIWLNNQEYVKRVIYDFNQRGDVKNAATWLGVANAIAVALERHNVFQAGFEALINSDGYKSDKSQAKLLLETFRQIYNPSPAPDFSALGTINNDFDKVLNNIRQAVDGFIKFTGGIQEGLDNFAKNLDSATEALALANQYFAAINSLLLAICQLIDALIQIWKHLEYLVKNWQDILWENIKSALLSLIPRNLWLKTPSAASLFLAEVQGLLNNIEGLGRAFGCFANLNKNPDGTRTPNPNMIPDDWSSNISAIANFSMDFGSILASKASDYLNGLPNPLTGGPQDVSNKKAKVALESPPPLVNLPEYAAFIPGIAAIMSIFSSFKSSAASAMSGVQGSAIADPETGQAAPPGANIRNGFELAKNVACQVLGEKKKIDATQAAAYALQSIAKPDVTEEELVAALVAVMDAGITVAATANFAVSSDGEPSRSADAYEACKGEDQGSILDGPDTPEKLQNAIVSTKPATSSNGSLMNSSGSTSTNGFKQNAPGNMASSNAEEGYKKSLSSFAQPGGNTNFEDLPVLLLFSSFSNEHTLFQEFKTLNGAVAAEQTLYAEANQRLLSEARQQGRLNSSPYTYLALLAQELDGSDLAALIFNFLRYDPDASVKIIRIAKFWEALDAIDPSAPIPELGDYPEAQKAAERSFQYVQSVGSKLNGLTPLILNLRTRSREQGGPAGFEHMVAAALVTAAIRIQAAIAKGDTAEVAAIAATAEKMKRHLTHPEYMIDFKPFLDDAA